MYDGIYLYGQHLPYDPSFSGWQRRELQVSAPRNINEVKGVRSLQTRTNRQRLL